MNIRGENFQEIADIYLGLPDDFLFNPKITEQIEKHQILTDIGIGGKYDNPSIVFVYPHHLRLFSEKIEFFANPFSLITHNSDVNITRENPYVQKILESPLLCYWWAQNLCFIHPKMRFLPIGFANQMWEHGQIDYNQYSNCEKTRDIFLNFSVYTNVDERTNCLNAMEFRVEDRFLPLVSAKENIERLAKYKWCVCPQGNGVDTHRLWEALALRCIPIVRKTPFIETLMHYTNNELPIIILDNWWDSIESLKYNLQETNYLKWLSIDWYATSMVE